MRKEIELEFDPDRGVGKETKNTIRYEAVEDQGMPEPIQTLYVKKWAFADEYPAKITVNIESE